MVWREERDFAAETVFCDMEEAPDAQPEQDEGERREQEIWYVVEGQGKPRQIVVEVQGV